MASQAFNLAPQGVNNSASEPMLVAITRCLIKSWHLIPQALAGCEIEDIVQCDPKILQASLVNDSSSDSAPPPKDFDHNYAIGYKDLPGRKSYYVTENKARLGKFYKMSKEEFRPHHLAMMHRGTDLWAAFLFHRSIRILIDQYDPGAKLHLRTVIPHAKAQYTVDGTFANHHDILILTTSDKTEWAIDATYAQYGFHERFSVIEWGKYLEECVVKADDHLAINFSDDTVEYWSQSVAQQQNDKIYRTIADQIWSGVNLAILDKKLTHFNAVRVEKHFEHEFTESIHITKVQCGLYKEV
ncbi:hypothetical protein B0J11DRAFT_503063 [Dendryphion nanum]|uniref:Uncharacterized protein n=1 Tax=Dendryphion nanum TaxID=256645 RepID=A0A9P9E6L1_9PLEO|nr:hypothetical protein B0J11DRAFT_503063 [Dendryphion nanum]